MIRIASVRVLLVLVSLSLFVCNTSAQSTNVKCPNKKSFWRNSNKGMNTLKIPKISIPKLPKLRMPKVGKFTLLNDQKIKLPEIRKPKMPKVSFDVKRKKRYASANCPN